MKRKRSTAHGDEVQENRPLMVSENDSSSSPTAAEESLDTDPKTNDQRDKKQGRGETKFRMAAPGDAPKLLEHNEYGQPIGKVSVDYSTFLGTLTRDFVPYSLEGGWTKLDKEEKNKIWICLKHTFGVEDCERESIFQHMGKLWRSGKSRLTIAIRNACNGKRRSRDLSLLKPKTMDQNVWDLFVRKTLSDEFQEKSAKFSEMRANQGYVHTTSRRGYAHTKEKLKHENQDKDIEVTRVQVWVEGHMRKKDKQPINQVVADKMKQILECPPESQKTTDVADDAISLVFGKEARGRVRGIGFGVTPSKVSAQVQQNVYVKQLKDEVSTLKQGLDELRSMLFQSLRQQNPPEQAASGGVVSDTGNGVGNGGGANTTTPKSNQRSMPNEGIPHNTKCKLRHWSIDGVVAEGRIASTDPNARVHHTPLGTSCWKVWVDKVIVEEVELVRPNDEMSVLEHARGSTLHGYLNLLNWMIDLLMFCFDKVYGLLEK